LSRALLTEGRLSHGGQMCQVCDVADAGLGAAGHSSMRISVPASRHMLGRGRLAPVCAQVSWSTHMPCRPNLYATGLDIRIFSRLRKEGIFPAPAWVLK
jgi:hypothetical protein